MFLAFLEGVACVWERGQSDGTYAWELVASRRLELEIHDGPGAGYTLMRPGKHYEWRGISLDVNPAGLRGPNPAREKPTQTFRVLNLGDSVAMGWAVREEETYGRRLGRLLSRQGSRPYEVINAGIPGWNLENVLSYLETDGLKYDPDLILLGITICNDIYGPSALVAHQRPALIEWLRSNTFLWPFLTIQRQWWKAWVQGRERIPTIDPPGDADAYFPTNAESARWDNVWNLILEIQQLARHSDTPLVLVLFPLEFQVVDENFSTMAQEVLTARAGEAGLPVVDLLPVYRRSCQEKPGGKCRQEDGWLFADVWMHPSAYGHKLAAGKIHAVLDNLDLAGAQ